MPGLMIVKSNEQLDAEAEAERQNMIDQPAEPIVSALVGAVHAAWSRNKRARIDIDRELLACLRQVKGEYDPEERQLIAEQGGGNMIYMMLAATKVSAATAWLQDVVLPPDHLPVGVESTEIPDLPPEVYAEMVRRVVQQVEAESQQQGQQQPGRAAIDERIKEVEADVRERVNQQANERAEKMTKRLIDQLEEGGFRKAMEGFLDDFATYPAAILKGPIYRTSPKVEWGPNWQPIPTEQLTVSFERVSPFDIYPSPDADNVDDGDFIERMRMTKSQIYALRDRAGYDREAVDRVLANETTGNLRHWLWTDSEREQLENKDHSWLTQSGLVDALHYWGHIEGRHLIEWGMDGDIDPLKPYHVEALVVGNECLRCSIVDDPLQRRPYQAASMFSKPGQFWGEALPKRIRNTCKMLNSIARSLADNLAVSSGPQVMVNVDALADGEDVTNLYPWKIWQTSYDMNAASGSAQPVNFYQPTANANELLGVYREFETKADDESGVPRYAYGNEDVGGAGQTASGLSMLFDATSKGIRKAISHIDAGVMRPLVEKLWMDEMRYGDDPNIKGDGRIVARGAAALLIADQAQARRKAFLDGTNNPTDMAIIGMEGRSEVLREFAKSLDMQPDRVVPSREELKKRQKEQAQQPDPEQQKDMAQLELDKQKAEQDAQQDQAELEQKERENERKFQLDQQRFTLDTARYLSGEEQKQFQRRMGLQSTPVRSAENTNA
ncbi:hypothetical protein V5738_10915 [Salinisphaera sp. SPP-AMP-43]|uniref:portal protein n=1 Tax=Salinisphaera sp. SPP-AMP-43 TaxID=3121288 RepID=UPI003C6DEEDA